MSLSRTWPNCVSKFMNSRLERHTDPLPFPSPPLSKSGQKAKRCAIFGHISYIILLPRIQLFCFFRIYCAVCWHIFIKIGAKQLFIFVITIQIGYNLPRFRIDSSARNFFRRLLTQEKKTQQQKNPPKFVAQSFFHSVREIDSRFIPNSEDCDHVDIFLLILNAAEIRCVHNHKENTHYDHIPLNLKGNINLILRVYRNMSVPKHRQYDLIPVHLSRIRKGFSVSINCSRMGDKLHHRSIHPWHPKGNYSWRCFLPMAANCQRQARRKIAWNSSQLDALWPY